MRSQTLATNDALYLGDLQILDEQYFEGEGMAGPSSDFNNMRLLPKTSVIALNCSKTFFSDLVIRHSGRTIYRIKPSLFVAIGCLTKTNKQKNTNFCLKHLVCSWFEIFDQCSKINHLKEYTEESQTILLVGFLSAYGVRELIWNIIFECGWKQNNFLQRLYFLYFW